MHRLQSVTEQATSARGSAGSDSQEGDEAAKIELTYSTTVSISRVGQRARSVDCVHNPGVMSQGDIAHKQAVERVDWNRRGVVGHVTMTEVDQIVIDVRTAAGITPVQYARAVAQHIRPLPVTAS
jgi:hypothetical protein